MHHEPSGGDRRQPDQAFAHPVARRENFDAQLVREPSTSRKSDARAQTW
jgi:hypothetical protein